MSLSLAYCLVIAPINILLKSFQISRSSRSIFSTSPASEITSSRINLESNKRYKRKKEWYNIWINSSSACRKVSNLSNIGITDWTNMVGCLNALTNLFSLLIFSFGSFSVGSSSKSKWDKKYDFQDFNCINFFSKNFPRLQHVVRTWLITFPISLSFKFINSLNCFF